MGAPSGIPNDPPRSRSSTPKIACATPIVTTEMRRGPRRRGRGPFVLGWNRLPDPAVGGFPTIGRAKQAAGDVDLGPDWMVSGRTPFCFAVCSGVRLL
jgi:hypothetical protein